MNVREQEGADVRRRVVAAAVVGLVVLAGAAGAWWWLGRPSAFEQALDSLPASTLRVAYTDWAAVQQRYGDQPLATVVEKAYDADLTRTSALEDSATALHRLYGISPTDADWEVYGQSKTGSVVVLRIDTAFDHLRSSLRDLGYQEPKDEDGVWEGSADLLSKISVQLTPVEQNIVLLQDRGLVFFSDDPGYAEQAARVVTGDAPSLLSDVSDLAGVDDEPASSVLWASDFACEALSMAQADPSDRSVADDLVAKAGEVSPLDGLVMSRLRDGSVTVAMQFESDEQASDNLQPRTDLASGDAPGQGGSFADRFSIGSSVADGRLVVLRLKPKPDEDALLSDISQGPVLFATC